MGGYPPFFVVGGFRRQKLSKKSMFFLKSLRRNAVNINVFAFFLLVAMEDASFEFVAIYGVLCMRFPKNTVNTSVFWEVVQKHCKKQRFGPVVLPKLANSGVFATCAFLVVAKNIVNTTVLARFGGFRVRKRVAPFFLFKIGQPYFGN